MITCSIVNAYSVFALPQYHHVSVSNIAHIYKPSFEIDGPKTSHGPSSLPTDVHSDSSPVSPTCSSAVNQSAHGSDGKEKIGRERRRLSPFLLPSLPARVSYPLVSAGDEWVRETIGDESGLSFTIDYDSYTLHYAWLCRPPGLERSEIKFPGEKRE